MNKASRIIEDAVEEHEPSKIFGLFSGGHDSLVATHIASQHELFEGAVHINTGIGIEKTREFVRNTCAREDWDLIELYPDDKTYEELVMEKGFPRGPQSHNAMYYYLKQRQIRRLVRENKEDWYDRIGLVTGVRRQESDRRMRGDLSEEVQRNGAQVWINPILYFDALELGEYIEEHDLDRNEVVDVLHRSGECLCGAFANPKELEEIEAWYPEAAEEIHNLEEKAREKGLVDCHWARSKAPGKTWDDLDEDCDMTLCQDCELQFERENEV